MPENENRMSPEDYNEWIMDNGHFFPSGDIIPTSLDTSSRITLAAAVIYGLANQTEESAVESAFKMDQIVRSRIDTTKEEAKERRRELRRRREQMNFIQR